MEPEIIFIIQFYLLCFIFYWRSGRRFKNRKRRHFSAEFEGASIDLQMRPSKDAAGELRHSRSVY